MRIRVRSGDGEITSLPYGDTGNSDIWTKLIDESLDLNGLWLTREEQNASTMPAQTEGLPEPEKLEQWQSDFVARSDMNAPQLRIRLGMYKVSTS